MKVVNEKILRKNLARILERAREGERFPVIDRSKALKTDRHFRQEGFDVTPA